MRLLTFMGLALLLLLCACQNSLDIKDTDLDGVTSPVQFTRSFYTNGESFALGYNNGFIRSDRVTLCWNQCEDDNFYCYKILRNGMVRFTNLQKANNVAFDSLLTQDTAYLYRVVCILKNGMAVDDTITIKTPQFLPPNQLAYSFPTPTSLTLTWHNRAESATGYLIEKSDLANQETTYLESATESVTDNQVVDTGTYGYRVRAENQFEATGWSPWMIIDNSISFDFESGNGAFVNLPLNGWEWGQDYSAGAHSGNNVWGTVLNGNYANNALYMLTSIVLTVPPDAVLEFYHIYDTEEGWDGGNVKISTNEGATWALIHPNGSYPEASIISSNEPGYSGVLAIWTKATFDLSAYAGQSVRFMWTFTSDSTVPYQGWYIDDVRVGPETDGKLVR